MLEHEIPSVTDMSSTSQPSSQRWRALSLRSLLICQLGILVGCLVQSGYIVLDLEVDTTNKKNSSNPNLLGHSCKADSKPSAVCRSLHPSTIDQIQPYIIHSPQLWTSTHQADWHNLLWLMIWCCLTCRKSILVVMYAGQRSWCLCYVFSIEQ